MLAFAVVAMAVNETVIHKFTVLKEARETASPITAQMRQTQLDCLARNIYHEAGYEPFEGKVAVHKLQSTGQKVVNFPVTFAV